MAAPQDVPTTVQQIARRKEVAPQAVPLTCVTNSEAVLRVFPRKEDVQRTDPKKEDVLRGAHETADVLRVDLWTCVPKRAVDRQVDSQDVLRISPKMAGVLQVAPSREVFPRVVLSVFVIWIVPETENYLRADVSWKARKPSISDQG